MGRLTYSSIGMNVSSKSPLSSSWRRRQPTWHHPSPLVRGPSSLVRCTSCPPGIVVKFRWGSSSSLKRIPHQVLGRGLGKEHSSSGPHSCLRQGVATSFRSAPSSSLRRRPQLGSRHRSVHERSSLVLPISSRQILIENSRLALNSSLRILRIHLRSYVRSAREHSRQDQRSGCRG